MRKVSLLLTSVFMLTTVIAVGCGEQGQQERRAPIRRSPKAKTAAGADRECLLAKAKGVECVAVQSQGNASADEIVKFNEAQLNQGTLILKEAMPDGSYKLTHVFQSQRLNNADTMLIQTFAVQVEPGQPPVLGNIDERRTPNAKNVQTEFKDYNMPVLFEVKGGQVNVTYAMNVRSRFQKIGTGNKAGDILPTSGDKDKNHVFSQLATMTSKNNIYTTKLNGNSRGISVRSTGLGLIINEDQIGGGTSRHFVLTYVKSGDAPTAALPNEAAPKIPPAPASKAPPSESTKTPAAIATTDGSQATPAEAPKAPAVTAASPAPNLVVPTPPANSEEVTPTVLSLPPRDGG